MAKTIPAIQLAQRIQQLVEERQQHADALARIDQTLASVGAALGGISNATNGKQPAAVQAASKAPAAAGKRRRGRGHFTLSAEESIVAFVDQQKNPTTAEINEHFKSEGRSTTANNALGKLVKEKQLKRIPLGKGIRGSRYSLA